MTLKKTGLALCLVLAGMFGGKTVLAQGQHQGYIHALSDLRGARWLLSHTPGNWKQTEDERFAIKEIEGGIKDIKDAAIEDGKNLDDHPPVQETNERGSRLNAAMNFLRNARQDVSRERDNAFAKGLHNRAIKHIDDAIGALNRAIDAGRQMKR